MSESCFDHQRLAWELDLIVGTQLSMVSVIDFVTCRADDWNSASDASGRGGDEDSWSLSCLLNSSQSTFLQLRLSIESSEFLEGCRSSSSRMGTWSVLGPRSDGSVVQDMTDSWIWDVPNTLSGLVQLPVLVD